MAGGSNSLYSVLIREPQFPERGNNRYIYTNKKREGDDDDDDDDDVWIHMICLCIIKHIEEMEG